MSGLEAIGVAASIIQVADFGAKLSVKLFSFYQRVRSASESIQLLSNEIALVSAILRELGDNLKEEEASKLCSKEAFRTLSLVLNQARDVLGQIQGIVDENDQKGRSRFQQMTGKLRVVYQETSIDQLKTKLERLKSTMLLLLNVITYAGQIRSSNVPSLVQEQRDLIQALLRGQNIDRQKPPESNATEGPREISDFGTLNTPTDPSSYGNSDVNSYHSSSKNRPRDSRKSPNNRIHGPRKHDEPSELKDYNLLIRSMLVEIESCKRKLESNRHSRIKNGILNIHSGEIMRFQIEHGHSIHIDQSLFADDPDGVVFRTKPPEEIIQQDSSDSDFSETDVSIRGRHNDRDISYRSVSRDRLRRDNRVSSHTEDRQRPPREYFLSPSAEEMQSTNKRQEEGISFAQDYRRASRNDSGEHVAEGSSRRRRRSYERVRPPTLSPANPLDPVRPLSPATEENQQWAYFKQQQEVERLGSSEPRPTSPGKPISPHTPHTPAIRSRLSSNSVADEMATEHDSPLEENPSETITQRNPSTAAAIDIPTSPRVYPPAYRRSSSAAQKRRPVAADNEEIFPFDMRSVSLRQEQEIEQLERELAKYKGPSSEVQNRRESRMRRDDDEILDDEDEDHVAKSEMQRRRERLERGSRRDREETRRSQMLRRLKRLEKRREYDTDEEEGVNDRAHIVGKDQYRTEIEDRRSKLGQREPRTRSEEESEEDEPVISYRRWRAKKMGRGGYADGKEEGFDRKTQGNEYPEGVATINGIDRSLLSHRSENDALGSDCSTVDIPPPRGVIQSQRYSHDVVPDKTWPEEVLLPENLEDLLAQWTTLDRDEIEHGQ